MHWVQNKFSLVPDFGPTKTQDDEDDDYEDFYDELDNSFPSSEMFSSFQDNGETQRREEYGQNGAQQAVATTGVLPTALKAFPGAVKKVKSDEETSSDGFPSTRIMGRGSSLCSREEYEILKVRAALLKIVFTLFQSHSQSFAFFLFQIIMYTTR